MAACSACCCCSSSSILVGNSSSSFCSLKLSLVGLPVTGGFIGKYFLFGGLIERGRLESKSWYYVLAVWAILNTVVSFYYYFRFIKVMYLGDRLADTRPLALSPALQTALVVSVIGVLVIGVYPQPLVRVTQELVLATFRSLFG